MKIKFIILQFLLFMKLHFHRFLFKMNDFLTNSWNLQFIWSDYLRNSTRNSYQPVFTEDTNENIWIGDNPDNYR